MAVAAMTLNSASEFIEQELHMSGYQTTQVRPSVWESRPAGVEQSLQNDFKVPQSVFSAGETKLEARRTVAVRIWRGQELWFAENERLDIYASGESIEEAMNQFKSLLVHFYLHYRDLDDTRAMRQALELKRLFEAEFIEVAQ